MKSAFFPILAFAGTVMAQAQTTPAGYTNFIRQVQMSSSVSWDATVAATGEGTSSLPIDTGGSRFELWTVRSSPLTNYLLDTRFVSAYAPTAEVVIRSEDPYQVIPRTRADRPFFVDVSVYGLLPGAADPEPSKAVKLLRHVQSYGDGGTGEGLERSQATLLNQAMVTSNGKQTLSYTLTSVPSADLTKVCGEERFSVYSLKDGDSPESQLASRYVQIWPVADGSIAGLTANERVRFKVPQLTVTLNDLYPESRPGVPGRAENRSRRHHRPRNPVGSESNCAREPRDCRQGLRRGLRQGRPLDHGTAHRHSFRDRPPYQRDLHHRPHHQGERYVQHHRVTSRLQRIVLF
jgi:hypothetical protein